MFPAYVNIPEPPTIDRQRIAQIIASQRQLDEPDGDDNGPDTELIAVIQDWVCQQHRARRLPVPGWVYESPSRNAIVAVHRAVPAIVVALMNDPDAENAITLAATESGNKHPMTAADRHAIALFAQAVDPNRRPALYSLQRAVEYAIKGHLTQSESAEFFSVLARQIAMSTGRQKDTHTTPDAASARLQIFVDSFNALDYTEQQHVAAVVAGLANATPERRNILRESVRRFLAHIFGAEDLAAIAKDCINWIVRKSSQDRGQ